MRELPEDQREQAAEKAVELIKAKKEVREMDAEIDRKGKIADLFCKAFERSVMLTPTEENVRIWTECTRMTLEELAETVQESRDLAAVFSAIADVIEQKILPSDWRNHQGGEDDVNDAQSEGATEEGRT